MRFFDKLNPTYIPATIQGVELQIKALNWAELNALQSLSETTETSAADSVEFFAELCQKYVQEADGTPIVFGPDKPADEFPVSFCIEVIEAIFRVSAKSVPTVEEAKKK